MDEGWTRWLLDEFDFAYERVTNPAIAAGNLKERFDVIVFPDQDPARMAKGYARDSMPEEFTGGINNRAVAALKAYLADGGTLVFLNGASGFALDELGVRARNVLSGVRNSEFYSPGSLLNASVVRHPLTYGLPPEITIWSQQSPAFDPGRPRGADAVARFPKSGILASGWLLGEKLIADRSPLLEVPVDQGKVILFGMRPQYRAQSYQTFKLFFNSLVR